MCGAIAPVPSRKHSINKPKLTSKLLFHNSNSDMLTIEDYLYSTVLHHAIWCCLTALSAVCCYLLVWIKCFWSQRKAWDHTASILFTSRLRVKKKTTTATLAWCIVKILVNSSKLFHNSIVVRKVVMTSLYTA